MYRAKVYRRRCEMVRKGLSCSEYLGHVNERRFMFMFSKEHGTMKKMSRRACVGE